MEPYFRASHGLSINAYVDSVNNLLAESGYARIDYATAQHYFLADAPPVDCWRAVIRARNPRVMS